MKTFIVFVLILALIGVSIQKFNLERSTIDFKIKFQKCFKQCRKTYPRLAGISKCGRSCTLKILKKIDNKFIDLKKIKNKKVKILSDTRTNSGKGVDSKTLWKRYRTELFSFLRQGQDKTKPYLQLVPDMIPAEWDDNPETLNFFLNWVPKFQSSYEKTNKKIPEIYSDFLMNVKVPKQEFTEEYEKLGNELGESQDKLYKANDDCMEKYQKITGYKPKYEDFKRRRCWKIDMFQQKYEMILFRFEQEKHKIQGGSKIFSAHNKFFEAKGKYNWTPLGSIKRFREAAKEGRVSGFDVKISERTSTYTYTQYDQNIGFGVNACIYGVKVGVDGNFMKSEIKIHTNEKNFMLNFGAKGYKAIPVYPGDWYSQSAVDQYRNGPFIKKPTTPYFGKGGQWTLIPKTIYVVVAPKIEMFVSESDKKELEKVKKTSISANIGYLEIVGAKFNFNKGSTMKSVKESDKLYKITIEGNSYEPQILAIDYDLP